MSKSNIVHTCYGCKYYYRVNNAGEPEYGVPFSYRHCDIDYSMNCDYVLNNGEPNVNVKEKENE